MTFWMGVATAYAVILVVGVGLGALLASKFPRRGGGGEDLPAPVVPTGPAFGLEDVPPLGSDFDRELLPAAFAELPV